VQFNLRLWALLWPVAIYSATKHQYFNWPFWPCVSLDHKHSLQKIEQKSDWNKTLDIYFLKSKNNSFAFDERTCKSKTRQLEYLRSNLFLGIEFRRCQPVGLKLRWAAFIGTQIHFGWFSDELPPNTNSRFCKSVFRSTAPTWPTTTCSLLETQTMNWQRAKLSLGARTARYNSNSLSQPTRIIAINKVICPVVKRPKNNRNLFLGTPISCRKASLRLPRRAHGIVCFPAKYFIHQHSGTDQT